MNAPRFGWVRDRLNSLADNPWGYRPNHCDRREAAGRLPVPVTPLQYVDRQTAQR